MNGEELLKNMDQLDDKLIQSAADANGKGRKLIFLGAVAAVLTVLTVAAAAFGMMNKNEVTLPSGTEIATEAETETDTKETVQTAETNEREYKDINDIPGAVLYEGRIKASDVETKDTFAMLMGPKALSESIRINSIPLVSGTVENLKSVTIRFEDKQQENGEAIWILSTFDLVVDHVVSGDPIGDRIKLFALNRVNSSGIICYDDINSINVDLFDGKHAAFLLEKAESFDISHYEFETNENDGSVVIKKVAYADIDFCEYGSYRAVWQFDENNNGYYSYLLEYLKAEADSEYKETE